jgi:hypothetical protein
VNIGKLILDHRREHDELVHRHTLSLGLTSVLREAISVLRREPI